MSVKNVSGPFHQPRIKQECCALNTGATPRLESGIFKQQVRYFGRGDYNFHVAITEDDDSVDGFRGDGKT